MNQKSRTYLTAGASLTVIAILTAGIVIKYANVDMAEKRDAPNPDAPSDVKTIADDAIAGWAPSEPSERNTKTRRTTESNEAPAHDVLNRRGPSGLGSQNRPTGVPSMPDSDEQLERQKDQIQAAVLELRPRVKACYDETLKEFPDASGKVVIGFEIKSDEDGEEGTVEMTELDPEKTTLFDQRLHDCMQLTIADLTVDPPVGGGTMKVNYPFIFSTGEDEQEEE